jgi:uncharacterized sulfatase
MMPHEPHNPPERILKKYAIEGRNPKLARYYAMCEWFDETCGQLLDYLVKKKLQENTLVIFMVDNGWIQETGPQKTTRGNFAPKSKLSPYDGGLRTPVLLRWPGKTRAGRYEDLVSTVDIVPTILKAAGGEPTPDMPGLDLMTAASGKGKLKREAVFGELYVHTAVTLESPALNLTHRWIRAGDWKLIAPASEKEKPELYNLKQDPFENHNLAKSNPARVAELKKMLDAWWNGR